MSRWSVVLAGGVGSRFWPLSTARRPKQLLPLASDRPLLADTVARLAPLVPVERILVLTGAALADAVSQMLPEVPRENVIAEPRAAGTAPALAWAAADVERRAGGDAVMLCVHADWSIGDPDGFRRTLRRAADVAAAHASLVTVGIVPSRPDPGFGYIQPGEAVAGDDAGGARRAVRFTEKPDRATATSMVRDGFLWNSGIFAWRAGDFLDEIDAHTPEVSRALPAARAGDARRFFAEVTPISVDHGVLERSAKVLVIPGDFGWDDVGTWTALRRIRPRDDRGNVAAGSGTVMLHEAADNVVYSEGSAVVLYGVSDLVVVARGDLTLVTTAERAADLKSLLDALPASVRDRA